MFDKILIANRGEIALRIIKACKEMEIGSVIVYSEADRDSLPVRMADRTICIGPAESSKSYLNIPRIISAAEIADVDAIHPGYGFLAENPYFADAVEASNITFIGPSYESMSKMGDKALARKIMRKAGVPIVPGSEGGLVNVEEAIEVAEEIGYPVIVKAVAGGGGRGMRTVYDSVSLKKAFEMASSEAEIAFGNPKVYLEKFIEDPRHIEFQIIADKYGNTIHLGERECSIQRRHQKLIEEAPSTAIDENKRERMGESAIKAAEAVEYYSAGTIEFLLDSDGKYYFMEMNTRIQVEHPITEEVTGVDLIKEQIRVAYGEKLSLSADDIEIKGHSIECRINAEDPDNDFAPSPGRIDSIKLPEGNGIRIDTHIFEDYFIPPFYDSLLLKLIVWAEDRDKSIIKMTEALDEIDINGVKTTIPFHRKVISSKLFKNAELSTSFIDRLKSQGNL
jgi:acetyl-CoA carboxylase biotin carboxylase subunit